LALLIFDRNLMPMPYPVITRILSISVSQTCGSLWPGWKSLRQKKSKKDCQKEYELHRKLRKWPDCIFLHLLIQSFWVPCDLSSKNFSTKNLLFEAEIYVSGYAQNAGFCTIYPRASWGLERPQAARTTSQEAGLIGQPKFWFRLSKWLQNIFGSF
jgi:hypothetical protein